MIRIRKCEMDDIPKVVQLSARWEAEDINHGLIANSADSLMKYVGGYFL